MDARQGVKAQTRRHAAILEIVGVRRVILAVNKMDLVGFSERIFREIEQDLAALAARFRFVDARAVPVSAKHGDNVARASSATPWYAGPTVLDLLDASASAADAADGPFCYPVQTVLRSGFDFRGLAGTVASGRITVGDMIVEGAAGLQAKVRRIVTMDGDRRAARSGDAVVLELDRDLDIARGAVLASAADPATMTRSLRARLVWLADAPLAPGQRLLFRTATDLAPIMRHEVLSRLDLTSLVEEPASGLAVNELATMEISLGRQVALDRFDVISATGRFVLVDALTGVTVAAGVVISMSNAAGQEDTTVFQLTDAILFAGVCADLGRDDPEFAKRATAAVELLLTAGVAVTRVDSKSC